MKTQTKTRLAAGGAATAVGVGLMALVGLWEGKRNHAYLDIVGVPTLCYGETKNVKLGQYRTDEECEALLLASLIRHEQAIRPCLKNPDAIPVERYQAYNSLAYNIGAAGFCRSSVARLENAGRPKAACDAILLWNRAGGRVIRGLQRRRESERALCLKGVA